MHAQLRCAQDLPTWFAYADNKWAFDVASVNGMLCGVFQAGVRGAGWLMLDDILAQDHQAVGLHNLLSPVFALGCGTAQGRRFFGARMQRAAQKLYQMKSRPRCQEVAPPWSRA
jgi:hypothetical protein